MSRPNAVSTVIASLEAERTELMARAAVIEQVIAKLFVSSQVTKPKARKPKLVAVQDAVLKESV